MSLKINLEIGHEATLRAKNTPEGFTHDWKIFVRGFDGANIHYYVEKVVFYLHETFQKPRRVIKEPPYAVKESGYAGFIVPIEVYLRNSGEPKKIKFSYDLSLQRTGPPLRKVRKEKFIFTSPPEDFKEKLLKGGAVVTSNSQEISENKSILHEEKNQLISKPKLSGDLPPKKPKVETPISNSFQDLFGTPITKTSKIPEPKAAAPSLKENKTSSKPDKDRGADKTKSKHSPHKDKERDKSEKKEKREEKKKDKERRDKDRDKSKEKITKMERSPKVRSPSPKNPSPKPSSPLPQATQNTSTEKNREKDSKYEKDKKDEEEKKNKKDRKDKDSRDKEKHRDSIKGDSRHREIKTKEASLPQESAASSVLPVVSVMPEDKSEKKENRKEEEKQRTERTSKSEERKHKHKKRDKHRKERKEEDEKTTKVSQKADRDKSPVNPTLQSIVSNTSSDALQIDMSGTNNLFGSDENMEPNSPPPSPKIVQEFMLGGSTVSLVRQSESSDTSRESSSMEEDTTNENGSFENDSAKKRKRTDDLSDPEESSAKVMREEESPLSGEDDEDGGDDNDEVLDDENMSDSGEQTDESLEEVVIDMDNKYKIKDDDSDDSYLDMDPEMFNTLWALKERILLVRDDEVLQEIVEVISDTGLYGLSNTFDFDLSEFDQDTVDRLLEILPPPSPPPPAPSPE